MPQGEKLGKPGLVVPDKQEYARKNKNVKRGGPMDKQSNQLYIKNLPGMIRNVESIAAGKAVQSGSTIRLGEIKEKGKEELKTKAAGKRAENLVTKVLKKGRNAKGVRGEFDIEQLAELAPELRKLVDQRAASKPKGPGAGPAAAGAGIGMRTAGSKRTADSIDDSGSADTHNVKAKKARLSGGGGGAGGKRASTLAAPAAGPAAGSGEDALFASDKQVATEYGDDFL